MSSDVITELLTWYIPAITCLAIFSYQIFKPTIYYDVIQRLAIGALTAYNLNQFLVNLNNAALIPISKGQYDLLIPLILGALIFSRLSYGWTWLSRFPQTWMAGAAVGLTIALVFKVQILDPSIYTGSAIFESRNALDVFSNIILVVAVVSCLIFYTYSRQHKGPYGTIAKIGRAFTLCAIGTSMTNEYIWASGTLIDRVDFLINVLRHVGIPL